MNTLSPPEPFFDFAWPVAAGYRWIEWLDAHNRPVRPSGFAAHPDTGAALVQKKGSETGPVLMTVPGPHTTIHPMDRDHAALFRRFAELDATNVDAILEFARQYGWLGVTRNSQTRRRPDGSTYHVDGEPQLVWLNEVAKMQRAIWLCERPQHAARNREELQRLFDQHLLQQVLQPTIVDADGRCERRSVPLNLLAAMWLQLSNAAIGNKTFVTCRFCPRQIEISTATSGFRSNRVFCSASCKTNDYRQRKRAALTYWRRGKTVTAVAKLVATNLVTVRAWIAAGKIRSTTAQTHRDQSRV